MKEGVHARDLSEWVIMEEPMVRPDEQGGYITEWQQRYSCWARIDPVMPSLHDEAWHVGQHITSCRYRVWIRGDFTVTSKMRVVWHTGGITLQAMQYLTLLSAPVFLERRMFQTFMTQLEQ